ncbi:MAG: IS982 family transposase [Dehalococcoidia bacterium]|nr:IS982 family transposase [Dehalococcoidia bacterium]
MDLDDFIITAFCMIDDTMKQLFANIRLRQRGPAPALSDSETLTMEVVGEYLSLNQDKAIYDYFRRHYSHFFPAMAKIHRTTFVRQATNLWRVKEMVWQHLLEQVRYDPSLKLVDSFAVPVCQFARAYRCRRFRGEAGFGRDTVARQTFYGFRLHALVVWPGVIVSFGIASAQIHETALTAELVNGRAGTVLADRNYWSPKLNEELARQSLNLQAQFKKASTEPWPKRSAMISRFRYRIETVFGQLVDRYMIKRMWARDMWHLGNRLLRKALSHTMAFMLNQTQGNPPLQISKLVI